MTLLKGIRQDSRLALRNMGHNPGFSVVVIVTLALGIGAVTTIFSLINGILLEPLPYEESGDLIYMWEKLPSFDNASVSYPNFLDWREQNTVFEDMAVFNQGSMNLVGVGDPAEVSIARISASTLPVLRAEPAMGRNFTEEEDSIGGRRVVLLSYWFWRDRLGEDPGVLGRSLILDENPYTVVGVMPADFTYPPWAGKLDLYVPVAQFAEKWITERGNHPGLYVIGRLKQGLTHELAVADMERVALHLEEEYPDEMIGSRVNTLPLQELMTRDIEDPLFGLLIAVTFLLMIACANAANLLLARATSCQHELAVRSALGARARSIIRLLLLESVILWIIGGILGIVIAHGATGVLTAVLADDLPRIFTIAVNMRVMIVALLISLVTGVIFGLIPAIRSIRPDLQGIIHGSSRTSAGTGHHRMRNSLVITEITLAVVLLVGAGLMIRSFSKMVNADTGIVPENILTLELSLPAVRYQEGSQRTAFFFELLDRIRAMPGVISAATTYVIPFGDGGWQMSYHVEGEPPEEEGQAIFAEVSAVSPDYFRTMGIPLLNGRDFTAEDEGEDTPQLIIVGERLAQRFWPDEDPIGKRIKWGDFDSESPWMEVVGVVGHVKMDGVAGDALTQAYIPHTQDNDLGYFLTIKTAGDPMLLVEPVRREVLALNPSLPISDIRTMEGYIRGSTERTGFITSLLGIFAATALLLATIGLYGVMSYATTERNHEIGIRMALGARNGHVVAMVVRQGMQMAVIGIGVGLLISALMGIYMASQLFGISALDPPTFILAPLFLSLVAAVATLIPAWRATSVDPVRILRRD